MAARIQSRAMLSSLSRSSGVSACAASCTQSRAKASNSFAAEPDDMGRTSHGANPQTIALNSIEFHGKCHCNAAATTQAANNERDDSQCRSYGATPGTQPYFERGKGVPSEPRWGDYSAASWRGAAYAGIGPGSPERPALASVMRPTMTSGSRPTVAMRP
jgi:hypothetical protein